MDENRKSLYESAISIYHSAESVLATEEKEEEIPNETEIVKSKEIIPMIENNNEQTKETNKIRPEKYLTITKLNLYLPWLSLFMYLFDVFSDQILAIKYATNKEWTYASLTCIFVILPAFYLSIFVGKTWKLIIGKGWKYYLLILPLVLFNLEPAIQYLANFFTVRKYLRAKKDKNDKLKRKYYDKYVSGNRNVSDLKYTESLMEALPQFTLQGYIILKNYDTLQINDKFFLQFASLISSVIGLAIIIFVRHKVWLLDNGYTCSEFGRALWTSGRFFSLVSRTLSLTISISLFPSYTLLLIGVHWLTAVIWRYLTHVKVLGYIEPIFQGAADTLVARVDSLSSNVISHAVMLIEDVAMVTVWFCHVDSNYDSIRFVLLPLVIVLDIIGCVSDILYKAFNDTFTCKIED